LFGDDWRIAGQILPYLAVSMAIRAALPTPNEILIPHGRVRRLTALQIGHMLFTLSISALGAIHSLELFALLQIPIALLFIFANYAAVHTLLQTSLVRLANLYMKAAITTCLCALPSSCVVFLYGSEAPIPVALLAGLSAVPLWFVALYIVAHPLTSEFQNVYSFVRRKTTRFLR
jgi:hypothetical protein